MKDQPDNSKQYNAAEILHYLSGQMDRLQVHALERAALDDDMLAEAIEGYRQMREYVSDDEILLKVNTLTPGKINRAPQKAKQVSIPWYRWIGYAAAATIVLGSGWWIFNVSQPDNILHPELDGKQAPSPVINKTDTGNLPDADVVSLEASPEAPVAGSGEMTNLAPQKNESQKALLNPKPTRKVDDAGAINNRSAEPKPQAKTSAIQVESATEQRLVPSQKTEGPAIESKRMMPATMQADLLSNMKFRVVDTLQAVPVDGWAFYNNFLSRSIPELLVAKPAYLTLTLNAAGKVDKVEIDGNFSDAEKLTISRILETGPLWKNHSGVPAKAILQW